MKAHRLILPSLTGVLGLFILTSSVSVREAGSFQATGSPQLVGCDVFPADNIWNVPVETLPVDANSAAYINTIGANRGVHADFGSGLWNGGPIGIPYVDVPGTQPKVPVTFDFEDESDPGPYPIPPNAPIEGGSNSDGDRHVLVVDRDQCILYELFYAFPQPNGSWYAGSGAIFDLSSNALRPAGWTSADAAGLPILPGLVRYDEVAGGEIPHAIRFTAPQTRNAYVWPARHYASSLTGAQYPPMGQRFRLRANFDISSFSPEIQVILRALKKYGMILADNGSAWFISGAPDERWDNDHLQELGRVRGSDFEAVDVSSLMVNPDSAQTNVGPPPPPTPTPTPTPPPESSLPVPLADAADYNGDGRADMALYRPPTGEWFVFGTPGFSFGSPQDIPAPGDYDGDGVTDYAFWRPSTGEWHVLLNGIDNVQSWGSPGDIPAPGDYNGDRRTDRGIFRPSAGEWWILFTGGGFTVKPWGMPGDIPAPADYDGDGRDDVTVFRPSNGTWYILNSSGGFKTVAFGKNGDLPVPGDYERNGLDNIALWRPGTGTWMVLRQNGRTAQKAWGVPGDLPVPADYDGDKRTDLGIFRPSTGQWFILTSSSRFVTPLQATWGLFGDIPVSASGGR